MDPTPNKTYTAPEVQDVGFEESCKNVPMGTYTDPTPKFNVPESFDSQPAPGFTTNKA